MRAPKPKPRTFYSKVAGVTHGNRQSLIRRHCRDGYPLQLRLESGNRHSDHAIGVWVRIDGWVSKGWRQLGYLPDDDDSTEEAFDLMIRGWTASATIWKVVGGDEGRNFGLRINVTLSPPPPPGTREADEPNEGPHRSGDAPAPPVSAEPPVELPAGCSLSIALFLTSLAASWLLFWLAGRPGDWKGISLVGSLLGIGSWGIAKALKAPAPVEQDERTPDE
jgi:hypothetical protein